MLQPTSCKGLKRYWSGNKADASISSVNYDSNSIDGDGECSSPLSKSRERQLRVNAASRRCRKRQKTELSFLRTHVEELQNALREQLCYVQLHQQQQLPPWVQTARAVHLSMLLDRSMKKTQELAPNHRRRIDPATATLEAPLPAMAPLSSSTVSPPSCSSIVAHQQWCTDLQQQNCTGSPSASSTQVESMRVPSSSEKKLRLLAIADFISQTLRQESRACIPQAISCLPISIDGWQLRMCIDEKHYTSHLSKFFPSVSYLDMFAFSWEQSMTKAKTCKKQACRVIPLSPDVALAEVQVDWFFTQKQSSNKKQQMTSRSLVCRLQEEPDQGQGLPARALICQQGTVDPPDHQDPHVGSWIFKRWLSCQPFEQDGVTGTLVESFRTGSYASGMRIYQGDVQYDDFCAYLIRRYVQGNALLESLMRKDPRFSGLPHGLASESSTLLKDDEISELLLRDLLMF